MSLLFFPIKLWPHRFPHVFYSLILQSLISLSFHRLLVRAELPFLAVHVNAAFSVLTGIQNSYVIGKSVSKILALDEQAQELSDHMCGSSNSSKQEITEKEAPLSNNSGGSKPCLNGMDTNEKENTQMEKSSLSSHDNAAAVGTRKAKKEKRDLSIECLIASNCFGTCYKVRTLGFKGGTPSSSDGSNNAGSNNSSISSKDLPVNPTICLMSICPVMTSSSQSQSVANHSISTSISAKRRKHGHAHHHLHHNSPNRPNSNAKSLEPSYFVIQLFLITESGEQVDNMNVAQTFNFNIDAGAGNGETNSIENSSSSQVVMTCG